MTYNLISVKRVIAKVVTDLQLQESDILVSDLIDWAADALEKIGAPSSLTTKVTGKEGIVLTPITNYQAQLPLDCYSVLQVGYTDTEAGTSPIQPMKYMSSPFGERQGMTSDTANTFISDSTAATSYITTDDILDLVVRLYDLTYAEALEKLNNEPELESLLKSLVGTSTDTTVAYDRNTVNGEQLEYVLVPGYIKTNVQTGYLMIAYKAVPVDEEGYPMMPDDQSFIEAIFWYINMKIKYAQWSMNPTPAHKDLYYDAKNTWNFYVKQAYGKSMMPATLDDWEAVKNVWNRLLPVVNAADSFYKYIGQQESIRTYR